MSEKLSSDDPRVAAAWEYAARSHIHKRTLDKGELLKAWLRPNETGFDVHMGVRTSSDLRYLFIVTFDSTGSPVSMKADFWRGTTFPRFLGVMSASMFTIWFVASFVAPQFAVKCPDCPPSLLRPPVTAVNDTTVYSGGYDQEGHVLPPIIRRDFICPRCHYTKVTYYVPGDYRPGYVFRTLGPSGRLSHFLWTDGPVTEMEWYQKALDRWHEENAKKARFKTADDWRAFWESLKASEHEERRPTGYRPQ